MQENKISRRNFLRVNGRGMSDIRSILCKNKSAVPCDSACADHKRAYLRRYSFRNDLHILSSSGLAAQILLFSAADFIIS